MGLKDSLAQLSRMQVYVGIPEAKSARNAAGITNAQLVFLHTHGVRDITMRTRMGAMMINRKIDYKAALKLYIHSKGSPLWQIPPRPLVEPAIEAKGNIEPIQDALKEAATAALKGKPEEAKRAMRMAGMLAQNAVRAWFTDPRNNWAPNAPSTIKRKGSNRPLIDLGEMRKAVTYVLDEGQL